MSFAVKHAVKKEVSGTFRLLPQGAGRTQNVPAAAGAAAAPSPAAAGAAAAADQLEGLACSGPATGPAPGRGPSPGPSPALAALGPDASAAVPTQDPARAERRRAMHSSRTMEPVAATTSTATGKHQPYVGHRSEETRSRSFHSCFVTSLECTGFCEEEQGEPYAITY